MWVVDVEGALVNLDHLTVIETGEVSGRAGEWEVLAYRRGAEKPLSFQLFTGTEEEARSALERLQTAMNAGEGVVDLRHPRTPMVG